MDAAALVLLAFLLTPISHSFLLLLFFLLLFGQNGNRSVAPSTAAATCISAEPKASLSTEAASASGVCPAFKCFG